MYSHIVRLFLGAYGIVNVASGTAIMVRSDQHEVAVAADSKRKGDPMPECKVRRINGGVFFASGVTLYEAYDPRVSSAVYNAYETGIEASSGLNNVTTMITQFTNLILPKIHDRVALDRAQGLPLLTAYRGLPWLSAGYALFVNGKPSFFVRHFYPILTPNPLSITFAFKDLCGPKSCGAQTALTDHAPLGAMGMEDDIARDPSLLNLNMLDFVTKLVSHAVVELPESVGPPLTRLKLASNDVVDWVDFGACSGQMRRQDISPQQTPPNKSTKQ